MMNSELSQLQKLSYASGGFGKNLAYGLVATYTLYYYNSVLGVSAGFVGMLLMVARIFDAFNDPLMGIVVAKTRSRFGRFKPWILTGSLLNALVLYAMFTVPTSLEGDPLKVYVTITYFLCGITYTLGDIPYWSVIPAVTAAGRIRENLTIYARTLSGIGAALPIMIGMSLVAWFGGGSSQEAYRTGFSILAAITAGIYVITTIFTVKYLPPERRPDSSSAGDADGEAAHSPTVKGLLLALIHNSHAMWIAVVTILFNTAVYMMTNLGVYLFQYDVGSVGTYTAFMTINGVIQFFAMVAVYPLLRRRFSNRKIFLIGCGCCLFGYAVLIAFMGVSKLTLAHFIIPSLGISIAGGITYVLTTVFLAGAVDYGEQQNGRRDESMISSLQTLIVKMSSAFAVFFAGIGLDIIRLEENVASPEAIRGLRMLFVLPSTIIMGAAFLIFLRHKDLGIDIQTTEGSSAEADNTAYGNSDDAYPGKGSI